MTHYKSWKYLNKALCDRLCEGLRGRITYFLTRYHAVHNSYGRARLDGKELAVSEEYKKYPEWVRQFYELRLILWEKKYVQQL